MDADGALDGHAGADADAGHAAAAEEDAPRSRPCRRRGSARGWGRRAAGRPGASGPGPPPARAGASGRRRSGCSPARARTPGRRRPSWVVGSGGRCASPSAVTRGRSVTMADSGTFSSSSESRWNGTVVTLAWGRRDTCSRMASAVLSWSTRCQMPLYLRSGRSTDTSVSPSASSRTTHSTAPRVRRRSGQSTTSSGTRCSPVRAHSSASSSAFDLVDGEVHGAQLVGRERAGVLDGPGGGHVEPVDEHQHHVAAQDRRGGGGGHVVLELLGLPLVLPVEAQQHDHEQRHDDEHHPGALEAW